MPEGERRLRLVDVELEVGWDDPRLAGVAAGLYRDATIAGSGRGQRLTLAQTAAGYRAIFAGDVLPVRRSLGELFADAEFAITDGTLARLGARYLLLHAAAVVLEGRALLAAGPPDAGKTSLAVALGRAGADLLSDEVAPVQPDGLRVHPFPRDFILHRGTLTAAPGLPPSPGFKCGAGYRYLEPSAICGRPPGSAAPAAGVLFPRRAAGAGVCLRPLGAAEAARRLLAECFDLTGLGERAVDTVARLAELPVAELVYDDAGAATTAVRRWLRSG